MASYLVSWVSSCARESIPLFNRSKTYLSRGIVANVRKVAYVVSGRLAYSLVGIRPIALALAASSGLHALDRSTEVSFSEQPGLRYHFAAGAILGWTSIAIIEDQHVHWTWWQKDLVAMIPPLVVGVAKEVYDEHHPKTDYCDVAGVLATCYGGGAVIALSHTWRW